MARLNVKVEDDIPDLLTELAGGQRKTGRYITDLVRAAHAVQNVDANELYGMKLQIIGLSAELNTVKARLQLLESK